ncbi:DUF6870 family protein [Lachnotalea glycerini]|uniref:DUF6870 domain-containing protein n=1 Tax=Lachnotalea glycerini TaxID=1763509 RepID=A0A371JH50_9FIRM|nr:hypothetical protein [Lachnotalea glycerini]RDY32007.1 hypothetical protein CG710_006825 [Lachnotalea glycerini]
MSDLLVEEKIEAMKNVDIRTVDKSTLVDIRDVSIDENLPVEERIRQLVEGLRNPYCFLVGDVAVKVEYEDTEVTFEQRFERIMINN